jgi:hypothetical protein
MPFNPNNYNLSHSHGQNRQAEYTRQIGTAQADYYYRRRKALRAEKAQQASSCRNCHMPMGAGNAYCTNCGEPVQQLRSVQRGAERPSSWKKRVGIMILITVAVLTLGGVLQAHSSSGPQVQSSSGMPGVNSSSGTPGVIIVGANIRTGPGTGHSIATTAPAGTKIVISCRIATPAGSWDKLTSPYRGLFVSATLVQSPRPAPC